MEIFLQKLLVLKYTVVQEESCTNVWHIIINLSVFDLYVIHLHLFA
jgi:hypothetical protein